MCTHPAAASVGVYGFDGATSKETSVYDRVDTRPALVSRCVLAVLEPSGITERRGQWLSRPVLHSGVLYSTRVPSLDTCACTQREHVRMRRAARITAMGHRACAVEWHRWATPSTVARRTYRASGAKWATGRNAIFQKCSEAWTRR